jgi:tRNA A-37 threonylcarbamoyl transferase component Bud32
MKSNNLRPAQRVNSNLKKQFLRKSALLLAGGCMLLSLLVYWNTRRLLMDEAMEKSTLILQEVEAIRAYVKDELRPKMNELHGDDAFIIEAMSTTYVSVTIMEIFGSFMPDYVYRRASVNPHNPRNLADHFEEEMVDWFEEDPDRKSWQGIVTKNGEDFFVSMVPDYFTPPCIRCHGKIEDAPKSLLERYGATRGFRFKAGDLAGLDSIAVPVSASLNKTLHGSLYLFVILLTVTLCWLWLLNSLFHRLVIERLSTMLKQISSSQEAQRQGQGDELDLLNDSFGSLQRYVRSADKGASLQPNFIGEYVVKKPRAAGAMSWLYEGYSTVTKEKVSLKIGFKATLRNPLYLACYETELRLLSSLHHRNLLRVRERLDDILILEEVKGGNLLTRAAEQSLSIKTIETVFVQLCDLIATLHSQGIVHHDLRPEILFMDEHNRLLLTDMGLATSDLLPDPVAAAGLGPQGETAYMAPEQINGKRGDPRSDIYGLGMLLFFISAGSLPFSEPEVSLHKWLAVKEELPLAEKHLQPVPERVRSVILRAIDFRVENRYQWVEDFQKDLLQALKINR